MNINDEAGTELLRLVTGNGEPIAAGAHRHVFDFYPKPGYVVKYDTSDQWANISEWKLWAEAQGTWLEPWLAPCAFISPRGLWLVQAKTTPLPLNKYPARIPAIFNDVKPENWGLYRGRPVCHDYAIHNAQWYAQAARPRLTPAVWEH